MPFPGNPGWLNRPVLERVLTLDSLAAPENVLLVGAQGLGKTMLAKNIAHQAILAGHSVLFTTAAELLLDFNGQETARARAPLSALPPPAALIDR